MLFAASNVFLEAEEGKGKIALLFYTFGPELPRYLVIAALRGR